MSLSPYIGPGLSRPLYSPSLSWDCFSCMPVRVSGLRRGGRGRSSKFWSRLARKVGLAVIVCGMVSWVASTAMAFQGVQSQDGDLQISIDAEYRVVKTGDKVEFNTVVTNNGKDASHPLIVAMNVINLDAKGEVV